MLCAAHSNLRKRSPEEGNITFTPFFCVFTLNFFPYPLIHLSLSLIMGNGVVSFQSCLFSVIKAWLEEVEMPVGKTIFV
jgi:hypothetical protein